MAVVAKKTKQKALKKTTPVKQEKKFISESLQKKKGKGGQKHKKSPKHKRRGVLYIKHLPQGFFEEQLRGYFTQFGAITRLRLARSPRTLGSKGYAFIEFRYPEVAEIAAEAMNNYLMFKNIIKTRFIPPSDIKHDYFRSSVSKVKVDGQKVFTSKAIHAREQVVENTNRLMTQDDEKKRVAKIGSRISKSKQKLAALGIDFDVDEVAANMGDQVLKAAENSKPNTIENAELASEDEADETFDPSKVDVDSGDEFEDFEYASEESEEDEENEVSNDIQKLAEAIKVAQKATKTATIGTRSSAKTEKRKEPAEVEVPAKKAKAAKKGKENKVAAVEKPVKAPAPAKAIKQTPVEVEVAVAPKTSKRNAKKSAPVVEEKEKVEPSLVKKTAKKAAMPKAAAAKKGSADKPQKVESPIAVPAPKVTKQKKAPKAKPAAINQADNLLDNSTTSITSPKVTVKAKKAQKAAKVKPEAKTVAQKPKPSKKAAPKVESPAPVKEKKLAKASVGIEKKKPAKATKTADKKMKAAASLAENGDAIVKVVKAKDIKGKKKAAK